MATFRGNKQTLYDIFQYIPTTVANLPHNYTTITEKKYHRIVTQ